MVYETTNYLHEFYRTHTHYNLSLGETDILKACTQLLPRILEHSLLVELTPYWNQTSDVLFQYNAWSPKLLEIYDFALDGSRPVEIKNKATGLLLRPEVRSIRLTAVLLGLSRNSVNRYLNKAQGFFSKVFNQEITINTKGSPLVESAPVLRKENN